MVILSKHSVMKHVLASLLIALILLLPACSGSRSYYDHAPATSSPPPPPPPLNVTIDYIGVKFDHDPLEVQGPGDICLVIVITDGEHSIEEILPSGEGNAFYLNDYETITLNQRVFHTASAGDYLKISILAYEDDPEGLISDVLQVGLPILGVIMGNPDIGGLSTVLSQYEENTGKPLFENKDDYVGHYEEFWGSDESWGIGQHNAVGRDDFRVWLSVWSDSQPQPVP